MSQSPPVYTKQQASHQISPSAVAPQYSKQQPTGQFIPNPHPQPQYLAPQQTQYQNPYPQAQAQSYPSHISNPDYSEYSEPVMACCPNCRYSGLTRIEKKMGTCQLVSGILMIASLGCWLPGLLTLLLCKDTVHLCSRCGINLGTKEGCC